MACWIGVDVGGKRRGFDVAVIDDRRLLALVGGLGLDAVVEIVDAERLAVVAIDSPRCCAPTGRTARHGELALAGRRSAWLVPRSSSVRRGAAAWWCA
jgi:predicted nuclease with RNAse H fold